MLCIPACMDQTPARYLSVHCRLWMNSCEFISSLLCECVCSSLTSRRFTFYSVLNISWSCVTLTLWSFTLRALATVYSLTSSRLFIKNPSVSSVAWHLPDDVGSQVTDWGCRSSMRVSQVSLCFPEPKHYLHRRVRVWRCCQARFLSLWLSLSLVLCTPLAGYMSPRSQSRTLTHNHSSCWIIQSKQWPTFKLGNKLKWRPGVESGSEADDGRSRGRSEAGRALTDGLRYWFVVRFSKKEAFLQDQQAWSAMWALESSPEGLRVPGHGLWLPVNVIKQAGTRIL